jgi:ribosomal protein S18 acetylase RimI-like enzyme
MSESIQPVTLRPATREDEAFLAQLFATTRPEFSLLDIGEGQREALLKMQLNAQRQQYDACYPLADNSIILRDGRPSGRILVDRSGGEVTLIDIALLPEHRSSGIGTGLMRKLLAEAAGAGKSVRLHVLKSNPALRLYERLGFAPIDDQGLYFEMRCDPVRES